MTSISIVNYNAICNSGENIEKISLNVFEGRTDFFKNNVGKVETDLSGLSNLPAIKEQKYNLRCNRLILKCLESLRKDVDFAIKKYGKDRIGIVLATTNSGNEEYETTKDPSHLEMGNPALFLKEHLNLNSFAMTVSTACTSSVKAFSTAVKLLENDFCDCVIAGGSDSLSKLTLYGFDSLEVLSKEKTNPFSKSRKGINIGEGCGLFILQRNTEGIKIAGIGETSDAYHVSTPAPDAVQAVKAIKIALENAKITPDKVDYINLHGTGTIANDSAEAKAVYEVFGNKTPSSSTKPLTGHCLGASAAIEAALCCEAIKKNIIYPHVFDGEYDKTSPEINLVRKGIKKDVKICMSNSFGFGGCNGVLILENE